jgi:hypothetical protein
MSGSDPEYEALSRLASDIRLLRTQCAEHGNSAAGKLLHELIEHMTESLHLLMDRPDALKGTMPWWRDRLSQQHRTPTDDLSGTQHG